MAKRILLIGAGLTSAVIANVLKRTQIYNNSSIELHIWEKARGAGGRFSTTRSTHNPNCTADLGAQYLTRTLTNVVTGPYFEVDGRIKLVPEGQREFDIFDEVVSTMPVPQLLQLENIDNILRPLGKTTDNPDLKEKLGQVQYTSRYALGLFYNEKLAIAPTESCMNFVNGNPVIRYWTLVDEKRLLVSFGAENIDRNADEVKEILLKHVNETCNSLQGKEPEFVKCQKWRYSQVSNGYEGSPGFVVLSKSPIILAAVQSGFENRIFSGE